MKNENKKTLLQVEKAGLSVNSKILVEGVSFEVREGEIVTLIGPNGSGKSTTAKIALGIHKNIMGNVKKFTNKIGYCLLYTSPSPRDRQKSRMPSSA